MDFFELRLLYTRSSYYEPYGGTKKERLKVIEAFKKENYKKVLRLARDVLEKDFLDLNTHFMCMISAGKMGDPQTEQYHRVILNGLIDSVVTNGDGRSPETAYKVISTREEEFVLTALGYITEKREEMRTSSGVIDKIFAQELQTGKKKLLYFNKDLPNKWLNSKYSKKEEDTDKDRDLSPEQEQE